MRSGRLRSCRQPAMMPRLGGGCSVLPASTAQRACSTSAWHCFSSTLRSRRPSPRMRCGQSYLLFQVRLPKSILRVTLLSVAHDHVSGAVTR